MTLLSRCTISILVCSTSLSFVLSFDVRAHVHPSMRLKARGLSSTTPTVLHASKPSYKGFDTSLDVSTFPAEEVLTSASRRGLGAPDSGTSTLASPAFGQNGEAELLSPVWKARLLLLLCAALYGTNYTSIKIVNEHIPVEIATALRFGLASLITLPWLLERTNANTENDVEQSKSITSSFSSNGVLLGGFEIGLWNAIGYFSQALGLQTMHASTCAFTCSLAVVIVPLLDIIIGKTILPRQMTGALLAVLGVGFLEMDALREGIAAGESILSKGMVLSLIQPLAFGVGYWRAEHYTRKFPTEGMRLTASQLLSIAMLSTMGAIFTSGNIDSTLEVSQMVTWMTNPAVLGAICWTGLVTTAMTTFVETFALKELSASEATIIYSAEPIFGSLCASVILGEQFGIGGYLGASMVIGGCLFSNMGFGGKKEEATN